MEIIGELYSHRLILTWHRDRPSGWELTSGLWSPFYFMFRHAGFFPHIFQYSVEALIALVNNLMQRSRIDVLVGVAATGIPLSAGVALQTSLPLAYTRKVAGIRTVEDLGLNSTAWGQHSLVEGLFQDGMRYLLVDDVVTGGASKELARRFVELEAERRGITLEFGGTVVVVDRGSPGFDCSTSGVVAAHRLYDELGEILRCGGTKEEVAVIRDYLERPHAYQDPLERADLLSALATAQ